MRHSWLTPLAMAGVATLLVGSALAQGTGSGSTLSAPKPGSAGSTPAPTQLQAAPPATQPGSPSVGTAPGKAMPTAQPGTGQTGSAPGMTTGSTKSMAGQANAEQVKSLQKALQAKGMEPGPIDGVLGPKTRAALRSYQKDQKLPETGRLDNETLAKLGISK